MGHRTLTEEEANRLVDGLAMHVRRLAYLLKTYHPESHLPGRAMDYLVKHGLSFREREKSDDID